MSDFEKEERYWQLTCGKELISVEVSNDKKVYIRNRKLDYIFNKLGFSQYMFLCSVSAYKDKEIPHDMSDQEKEQLNNQMLLHKAIFLKEFVLCEDVQYSNNGFYRLVFKNKSVIDLSNDDMNLIFTAFREIYCLSGGKVAFEDAKPATERGKKFLEMMRKGKASIDAKKSGNHTIDSIIMGVTSKHSSYNLLNIWDLTMWQLMQTHNIMYKIDGAYFYKIGVYTGNIDTEKSKTTARELDWSSRD